MKTRSPNKMAGANAGERRSRATPNRTSLAALLGMSQLHLLAGAAHMAKSEWKLVTEFPISVYRCGARAGERVRLLRELVIRDHKGKPTGKVHPPGEIWCVVRGAAEEPRALWLRETDGRSHTWDDNDN